MRSRLAPLVILWCATLAGWLLQGAVAPIDGSTSAARVGLLPTAWWLAGGAGLITVASVWARPSLSSVLPLALSAVLLLPWLPLPIPPAFLALVGPASGVVAVAIVVLWLVGSLPGPPRVPVSLSHPRRGPIIAGFTAAAIFGLAAWRAAPMLPGGDEPHYLVATQSLLYDGDLKVENNYRRRDYRQFVDAELQPHFMRRGQDGEIYSIHLPGVSVLVLPAFALAGHPGAITFLVIMAALGMALVWRIGWELTGSAAAAWFAWASASVSTPVLFQAFTVGPDGPAAVLVLVGVWALLRASRQPAKQADKGDVATKGVARLAPWLGVGSALALLPWLHARLAALAGVLGLLLVWQLLRRPGGVRLTAAFLLAPVVSAVGWFSYFYAIYGEVSPEAPYRGSGLNAVAHMPSGIGGLFFDHQFGLVPNAPVFLVALIGVGAMLCSRGCRRSAEWIWLGAGLTTLVATYVLAIAPMRMWWAGWSAPARFAVPFLSALAVATAVAWQVARRRVTRAAMLCALGASAGITALLVTLQRGRLAYNVRDTWSLLHEWLSPLVVLSHGMPDFHRLPEYYGFYHAAIWLALLLGAWLLLRVVEQKRGFRSRAWLATAVPLAFGVAVVLALSLSWKLTGATVVQAAPAQLRLLRRIEPGTRQIGLRLTPLALLAPAEVAPLLRIRSTERWLRTVRDGPLFVIPGGIPAGRYRLLVHADPSPAAQIVAGIGREMFPVSARVLPASGGDSILPLNFAVDVRAIIVRGNGEAAAAIRDIVLQPRTIRRHRRRNGRQAQQATIYPGGIAYFLDDRAFVDVGGFWVVGGQTTDIVVASRRKRDRVRLALRNGRVPNQVTLRNGGWQLGFDLAPRETREVDVPILVSSGPPSVISIGSTAGFRRSDVNPQVNDRRWLGVRVELP